MGHCDPVGGGRGDERCTAEAGPERGRETKTDVMQNGYKEKKVTPMSKLEWEEARNGRQI